MAKNRERGNAKVFFLQGKTQKEIARLVSVQEKTIGEWVKKYSWKAERDARISSSKNQVQNIKNIISTMAEERLEIQQELTRAKDCENKEEIERLQKEAARVGDEVSKWNKTLENMDKENRVSLSVYLDVMDDIFKAMQQVSPKIFMQTLDFQEAHLSNISLKLG